MKFDYKHLSQWFVERGYLLVLSLVLAILAWLFVHSGQITRIERAVKVDYINLPLSLAFAKPPLQEVQIYVTGSFHRLRGLEQEDLTYLVDLRNSKVGKRRIEIDLSTMRLPYDIRASNPRPRAFDVSFEQVVSKEVPINPQYVGKIEEGYAVTELKIDPDPVGISGPRSIIEGLEKLNLEIDVDGRKESFSTQLALETGFPQVEASEAVLVEVEIKPISLQRSYTEVPVVASHKNDRIRIEPAMATLSLEGPQGELDKAEKELKVVVPTEGLKRGKYRIRGTLEVKADVDLLLLDPETFIVEVLR